MEIQDNDYIYIYTTFQKFGAPVNFIFKKQADM